MLAEREGTIDQLLTDYDTITTALASREAQIGQMVENLVAISETFAGNDALLDQALVELAQLSQGFEGILDQIGRDHVYTPVTNAPLVCPLLFENKSKEL